MKWKHQQIRTPRHSAHPRIARRISAAPGKKISMWPTCFSFTISSTARRTCTSSGSGEYGRWLTEFRTAFLQTAKSGSRQDTSPQDRH